MSAYISVKKSLVFLLCGLICAAGMLLLVNFVLRGPRLGLVFDFFLDLRHALIVRPPVSREILIINSDDFVESADVFSVLMTLTEMRASNLLLAARVSGSPSPITESEAEIRFRFYDEYAILRNNIRNLFEAIRLGTIHPGEASLYVERLVELTEQSRERLLSILIDRDEDLVRSAVVFGNYMDFNLRPAFDPDGRIRRVSPINLETNLEHPVYLILKYRYAQSHIEISEFGQVLFLQGNNDDTREIALDRGGSIIITASADDFRHIDIEIFRRFDEELRILRHLIREANTIGVFSKILPEESPFFLEEYANVLRDELLRASVDSHPSRSISEKREAWIQARENYFKSLNSFLFGPSEMLIISGYDEVIAEESDLGEEGIAALFAMRDEVIDIFYLMRMHYNEFIQVLEKLQLELSSSFVIMGPGENTKYSALLANAILTGEHIIPSWEMYVLYWSMGAVFLIMLIIFRLRSLVLFFAGFILSLVSAFGFGAYFIYTSIWIDPTIVFSSSFTGTIVIFTCKCVSLRRRAKRFTFAYGAAVSGDVLKELINRGKPEIKKTVVAASTVIAIRDFNLLKAEDHEKSADAGKAQKKFYSDVKEAAYKAGGVIAGFQGDMAVVCMGSSFDNEDEIAYGLDPVEKAYTFVKQMLQNKNNSWRFGMDAGKCTFSWSVETGFCANGRPVVRAKILASKNARHNTRALITDAIREETNLNVRQVGFLYTETDAFYELKN